MHSGSCIHIHNLYRSPYYFFAPYLVRVGFLALMGASLCCLRSPNEPLRPSKGNSNSMEYSADFGTSMDDETDCYDKSYILRNAWSSNDLTWSASRRGIPSVCNQLTTIQEESPSTSKKREKTISTRAGSYGSLAAMSGLRCRTISSSDDDVFYPENFGSMRNYQRFVTKKVAC